MCFLSFLFVENSLIRTPSVVSCFSVQSFDSNVKNILTDGVCVVGTNTTQQPFHFPHKSCYDEFGQNNRNAKLSDCRVAGPYFSR